MIRDDWLMRQVNAFAAGLAQRLAGETAAVEEAELDFESVFGTSPQLLAAMSEGALLTMVRTEDGVDSVRALALAFGIAHVNPARALALMDVALSTDPELATDELRAYREVLVGDSV